MTTLARARTRQTSVAPESVRSPVRDAALGPGVAIGRDGKPIKRIKVGTDPYYIPPGVIPDGWVYQFKRKTVHGMDNPSEQAAMQRGGWTPVPAERHDGFFLPAGVKGEIVIGGLILMERPVELEEEARWEDKQAADAQVNGSRRQFGFAPVASGFEGASTSNNPVVRSNSFARRGVERVDAPTPKHEVIVDD